MILQSLLGFAIATLVILALEGRTYFRTLQGNCTCVVIVLQMLLLLVLVSPAAFLTAVTYRMYLAHDDGYSTPCSINIVPTIRISWRMQNQDTFSPFQGKPRKRLLTIGLRQTPLGPVNKYDGYDSVSLLKPGPNLMRTSELPSPRLSPPPNVEHLRKQRRGITGSCSVLGFSSCTADLLTLTERTYTRRTDL